LTNLLQHIWIQGNLKIFNSSVQNYMALFVSQHERALKAIKLLDEDAQQMVLMDYLVVIEIRNQIFFVSS